MVGGEADWWRESERMVWVRARLRFAPTLSPVSTIEWAGMGVWNVDGDEWG